MPTEAVSNLAELHKNNDLELDLFLEAIYRKYGYDFRSYSRASLRRRVQNQLEKFKLNNICELIHLVVHDEKMFLDIFDHMTVNVTEMFRDPHFYKSFREKIAPQLKSYPSLKIWHAGCSTGQEIYSMCILLQELGLYDKAQIYATDIDHKVIEKAKKGIFPIENAALYSQNYRESGGLYALSDYYTARYDSIIMDSSLKKNIIFADHDLATDQAFSEMHVVICRNVLIYFNQSLQDRVFRLFSNSLDYGGYLCLGSKESLRFSSCNSLYKTLDSKYKIYQKTKQHDMFSLSNKN
ncbi:MAG: protein-glutamate O-methyltransferase CheR [Pseudomonadales bacterium]|nr:protein-glutamate O-methyltransferase CheR [Pseudomonadales bacterium]